MRRRVIIKRAAQIIDINPFDIGMTYTKMLAVNVSEPTLDPSENLVAQVVNDRGNRVYLVNGSAWFKVDLSRFHLFAIGLLNPDITGDTEWWILRPEDG